MKKRFGFTVSVSWAALLSLSYYSLGSAQPTKLTLITNLGVPAVLAEPDSLGSRSHIGIVTTHSDGNYLSGSNCIPLAQRGYRSLHE